MRISIRGLIAAFVCLVVFGVTAILIASFVFPNTTPRD